MMVPMIVVVMVVVRMMVQVAQDQRSVRILVGARTGMMMVVMLAGPRQSVRVQVAASGWRFARQEILHLPFVSAKQREAK